MSAIESKRRCARQGFTIIEVLVCCLVVGLLAGLLLPAIHSIRERARQVQCQSQLRQLGLALHQFHETHLRTPPGQLFGEFGTGPDSRAWSWIARLLPYLEQHSLYDEGRIPVTTLRESGIADRMLPILLCPSDPESRTGPRTDAGNMIEHRFAVGQTNYKAVCGSNWGADLSQGLAVGQLDTPWIHRGANGEWDGQSHGDGFMYRTDHKLRRRLGDVTDGTSRTLMFGECLPDRDAYCSWPYTNNAYATCAIPLNHAGTGVPEDWPNMLSFRSRHPGGANFCYVDGHVRFINESIDLEVYRSLATINGAEVSTGETAGVATIPGTTSK